MTPDNIEALCARLLAHAERFPATAQDDGITEAAAVLAKQAVLIKALEQRCQEWSDENEKIEDERDALQARVRGLEQFRDWAMPQVARPVEESVIDEINALRAENEGLRKDAQRYRWLRNRAYIVDEDGGWASHYRLPTFKRHNDSPVKQYRLMPRSLDAAVDAAMAAGQYAMTDSIDSPQAPLK